MVEDFQFCQSAGDFLFGKFIAQITNFVKHNKLVVEIADTRHSEMFMPAKINKILQLF